MVYSKAAQNTSCTDNWAYAVNSGLNSREPGLSSEQRQVFSPNYLHVGSNSKIISEFFYSLNENIQYAEFPMSAIIYTI